MTYRKKLIEVALPLEAISVASAREKSIRHGHPSTLHLWWSRKPLATTRAVIFASLVDDPDNPDAPAEFVSACKKLPAKANTLINNTPRMRLFDFIEDLVKWESTTDEQIISKACELIRLSTGGNPPPLLDPFAGGGSIPLEAQRLGLEAHASDLNPVAVMINKAMIEIPPRFANRPPVNPRDRQQIASAEGWKGAAGLAADVRYYGEWMSNKAFEKIGHLYPTLNGETVISWLWARTVTCPNPACKAQMPIVNSFWLSQKKGSEHWLNPVKSANSNKVNFEVRSGVTSTTQSNWISAGTGLRNANESMVRATFMCPNCNTGIAKGDYIDAEANAGRMGTQLIAIITKSSLGRAFHAAVSEHSTTIFEAEQYLINSNTEIPSQPAKGTFGSNAQGRMYGFRTFADYFTPRQLVGLITLSELISEVKTQICNDACNDQISLKDGGNGILAYAEAICVYLGFAISKFADNSSSLCSWHSGASHLKIRATFSRQAIPMTWTFAEGNAFSDSSGNFFRQVEIVSDALEKLPLNRVKEGTAFQADASTMATLKDVIVSTDPPYYDNIVYSDLSDFFYVWLRRSLQPIYPEIFKTLLVPKAEELVATRYRFEGNQSEADEHFEAGLHRAFDHSFQYAHKNYPVSIYYAFKQAEAIDSGTSSTGWEKMLQGLIRANFTICGTWPMRTELSNRMVGMGTNVLASSIVLVCRPRPDDAPVTSRREFINMLRRELPDALKQMQSGNIAPVDLAQAAIGPGMAVYSRYSKVLEADGSPLTVRTALQIINQELDAYFSEQEGDVDADTRFAIAWFDQHGFDDGVFGQADVLARAKNTSVDGLVAAGIAVSGQGKVRLIRFDSSDPAFEPSGWDPQRDKRPTVWEGTHYLIERLNTHAETGAAMLLNQMSSDLAAEARELAYRLYSICERKGRAKLAGDYNALVISFPHIQERAAELRREQAESGTQMGLFDEG